MNQKQDSDGERDGQLVESTPTMALLNKSEIDQQVATAHAYPRSIKQFLRDAEELATMNEEVADSCGYALPRKSKDRETGEWITKNIEGPSARFAEIVLSCWGNARAGTRIVDEGEDFITAEGFMFDLQKNVAIQVQVPRRITDSQGRRFKTDMIGVTANAAASIALRNAILKVVPRAMWEPIYQKARATAVGTEATLSNKRIAAIAALQKRGASAQTVFDHFKVKGIEDITLEHLGVIKGYITAIKEGDSTVEGIFGNDDPASSGPRTTTLKDIAEKGAPTATPAPTAPPATATPAGDASDDTRFHSPDRQGLFPPAAGGAPELPAPDDLVAKMKKAKSRDALQIHADWIRRYPDEAVKLRLTEVYEDCLKKFPE